MAFDKFGEAAKVVKTWQGSKSVCTCGHTGDGRWSQHTGRPTMVQNGHGRCLEPGCKCGQFTWGKWTGAFQDALHDAGAET